ncbi:GntR family transcriptional regulator [Streptomyces iconiensis]|uniref:GntR family transcriptional regulator n=1 Tax=Streptomyces iconiensis TaxID=1384038 RepID=A0ABT7A754_9ACTN|nr:GntR family transcriptional regulator [Streptomyces iconiensis]MDJ1137155.1 GntR family transcriptional regulator [Streptomyces iconiensis]
MSDDVLDELAADRNLLSRTSTAERVADILRSRIIEGAFRPGARLPEEEIGAALGVSRNTLREAFRLLTHERLLAHRLNRGMFVRVLTVEDLEDIYRVRSLVQCAVLRALGEPPYPLAALESAVTAGRGASSEARWRDLGTANMRFHQAMVELAGSPRTDALMRGVLAELRLVFHVMDDPRRFHEPYLVRNEEILRTLQQGEAAEAERLLAAYLDDSRSQLAGAYATTDVPRARDGSTVYGSAVHGRTAGERTADGR